MIKEAINKIQELVKEADVKTIEIGGHTYITGNVTRVDKPVFAPEKIGLNSLNGLISIIKTELEKTARPLFLRVSNPTRVDVFSTFNEKEFCKRQTPYAADAVLPNIRFDTYDATENMIIELRSKYINTADTDTEYALSIMSKISDKSTVETEDNGMSQSVQIKKGFVLVENAVVKPIVKLRPYRTFLEVEQPVSEFLLRFKEGGYVALYEADGGKWKMEAKANIKKYLEDAFVEEIKAGSIVILA